MIRGNALLVLENGVGLITSRGIAMFCLCLDSSGLGGAWLHHSRANSGFNLKLKLITHPAAAARPPRRSHAHQWILHICTCRVDLQETEAPKWLRRCLSPNNSKSFVFVKTPTGNLLSHSHLCSSRYYGVANTPGCRGRPTLVNGG